MISRRCFPPGSSGQIRPRIGSAPHSHPVPRASRSEMGCRGAGKEQPSRVLPEVPHRIRLPDRRAVPPLVGVHRFVLILDLGESFSSYSDITVTVWFSLVVVWWRLWREWYNLR